MVRGACAGEVVLNERCNDVVDIVPVDPATIWFRREKKRIDLYLGNMLRSCPRSCEEWFGQYKNISTLTLIYKDFDLVLDVSYG